MPTPPSSSTATSSTSCRRWWPRSKARSVVPEVGQQLAVAGVVGAEGEDLEALGAGLEAPGHLRRDADGVQRTDVHRLPVELDAAAPGEDDVDLLRLLVAVSERLVAPGAHQVVGQAGGPGVEVPGGEVRLLRLGEAALDRGVLDLAQVLDRVGHGGRA